MSLPSRQEIEAHVHSTMDEMKSWACKEFGFPTLDPMDIKVSFHRTAQRCSAGVGERDGCIRPVIWLNVYRFTVLRSLGHEEYDQYKHDLEIGGFQSTDWKLNLDGLLAHEFSHAIQYILPLWPNKWKATSKAHRFGELGRWASEHSSFFQEIYRKVRREFVNHRLDLDQLVPPINTFELEILPSRLSGRRFRYANGHEFEILGLRPRARSNFYLAKDLSELENYRFTAFDLLECDPSMEELIVADGIPLEYLRLNYG